VPLDPTGVEADPGGAWSRAWTATVDAALAGYLVEAGPTRPVSLVALGSYARRELCPASDVDLLVLHDGWPSGELEALVRALCYPLWDAGLSVGHAVRTAKESVRAAGERTDTATALTDRRLVAGDAGLASGLGARVSRWLRRSGGQVLSDLAEADRARRGAAGAHVGMLEPDLKSGAGGLRDLHSLRWAAACVLGEVGIDPLVGARYLSAVDRHDLADAGELLLAVRCALHLVQGRGAKDVLRLDLQDEVAARLGMADGDELLHAVNLATRRIAHVHGRTWAPLLADATQGRRRRRPEPVPLDAGVALVDGLVEVAEDAALATSPSLGLRAVAAAAEHGAHLGRSSAERLSRQIAALGELPWDGPAREALLAALAAGARGLGALRDADHLGLLSAHLPEWERVRGRPQRNPLHTFDLDTHGIQAVCELVAIAGGSDGAAREALFEEQPDPDVLLLGTFLHDVGKAWPGDHSDVGAPIVARWVTDMGFGAGRAGVASRLVRHHLLLPDVATRRDIDDPDEVRAVARAAGDIGLLDGLYLLALADSRATGPSAHSPWKDGLIAELHARARGMLAEDPTALAAAFDPGVAAARARRDADADPGSGPVDGDAVARLLAEMGDRYALAASTRQCAVHAALADPPPGPGRIRASWDPGMAAGTEVLSVVAPDRLGFVADCAAVLAGWGVRVLDARAFTRPGDPALALDWFVVEADPARDRDAIAADLARVAGGEIAPEELVARREAHRDVRPPVLAEPVPVRVRFDVRDDVTRVEVHAPDAPGLLSRLARELAVSGLGVQGARVATLGPAVRDVFFLRTPADPPEGGWDGLAERLRAAASWPEEAGALVRRD
jgi:[protein-PII] uridylyltransferase